MKNSIEYKRIKKAWYLKKKIYAFYLSKNGVTLKRSWDETREGRQQWSNDQEEKLWLVDRIRDKLIKAGLRKHLWCCDVVVSRIGSEIEDENAEIVKK